MKNKDKYDLNELDFIFTPRGYEKRVFVLFHKRKIIYTKPMQPEEFAQPVYNSWLESEYVQPILDKKEKAYLSAVIKPFRKDVECIMKFKRYPVEKEFIRICMKDNYDNCTLPDFEKGTMYKGMERGKEYTLEELGL